MNHIHKEPVHFTDNLTHAYANYSTPSAAYNAKKEVEYLKERISLFISTANE